MRIISGFLRRKKLEFYKTNFTRPLKDSVKENIFNILNHSNLINVLIKKSKVLDLYSGFGSFGLECISRSANQVTFMEKDKKAINSIKKNLAVHSIENKAHVIEGDIRQNILKFKKDKFDIFFFDPPFADTNYIEIIKIIKEKKFFNKNHILIIHREKNSNEDLKLFFKILIEKNYGRSKIIFGKFN